MLSLPAWGATPGGVAEHFDHLEDMVATGPEHYAKAEEVLDLVASSDEGSAPSLAEVSAMIAVAQVHATLALSPGADEELVELRGAVQEYLAAFDGPRIDQAIDARDRLRVLVGGPA